MRIITCDEPAELYCRYRNQHAPQPCYIEVDLDAGILFASYDPHADGKAPEDVFHGITRRYSIPALTSAEANKLLRQVKPLAARMARDWEKVWDGNAFRADLGEDAEAAETQIRALVGDPNDPYRWGPDQLVAAWDVDSATNGDEVEEYNITAATTDQQLEKIEEDIRSSLLKTSPSTEIVLEGVGDYLANLRDDLR